MSLLQNVLIDWQSELPITLITEQLPMKLRDCRVAIVCSGTATFECAMLSVPMVVVYKTHWLNYLLARWLVRVRWLSLPNLLLNRSVVPELIQGRCKPQYIEAQVKTLLEDSPNRQQQMCDFSQIIQSMSQNASCRSISQVVTDLLG